MGILDDVVVNAKAAADAVGKKAGQIVDISKLRISISETNSEINKRYQALGEYVYDNAKSSVAADEAAVALTDEIDELLAQLATFSKELSDKQNKKVCSSCGKQCSLDDSYCSGCGAKLEESAPSGGEDAPKDDGTDSQL